MNEEIKEIIQDRLNEEVGELVFLQYRKSLGWKNKFPLWGLPMSMEFIKGEIKYRESEVKRIRFLLNRDMEE